MRSLVCILLMIVPFSAWAEELLQSTGASIYVPVYSHIYTGDRERPFNLAVTLSVRNTDTKSSLRVLSVAYYDSSGRLLRELVKEPFSLGPLSATRYVIGEKDTAGGSGASCIVRWKTKHPISVPVVESIMIGTQSGQGISFVSPGRVVLTPTP